jgi:hypothetical protein
MFSMFAAFLASGVMIMVGTGLIFEMPNHSFSQYNIYNDAWRAGGLFLCMIPFIFITGFQAGWKFPKKGQ